MKLVTIHQPNYMPWPGFFHKWMVSDSFIILDTVQFHKNEWQNRNRIKTISGAQWITVPVSYRFPQTIIEVGVASSLWAKKQCASIEQAYSKAPYFEMVWPTIADILKQGGGNMADMNVALIRALGSILGCSSPLFRSSEMHITEQDPTMRLIHLVQEVGGDAYLSGSEGRNYLSRERFSHHGVKLYFQNVEPPVYSQLHGEFIPYLSVLDLLFNQGPKAKEVVRKMGGVEE